MIYLVWALVIASVLFWLLELQSKYWRTAIGYAKRRPKGYIYYFRGDSMLTVKIGRTKNVLSRLRSHRTANPYGIEILGVVPVWDDVYAERHIHEMFADQRVSSKNEWFYLSPRLWWYIRATRDLHMTYDAAEGLGVMVK